MNLKKLSCGIAVLLGGVFLLNWCSLQVRRTVLSAQTTSLSGNGRGIYMLMYAAEMDAFKAQEPTRYPTTNDLSSTAYFNSNASGIFMDVAPSFFSGPRIVPAKAWPMTAENNAWSLNVSFTNWENVASDVPFLISRNLRFRAAADGSARAYLVDEPPFGKRGAVLVTCGGATMKLRQEDIHIAAEGRRATDVSRILLP